MSKFAPREEHKANWYHHLLIRQILYCVISEAEFLISILINKLLAFKAVKLSMLQFEASCLSFESLYFKILRQIRQSTVHLVYLPAVPSHEILYPCFILGHKIACFYASEGIPNKRECKNIFIVIVLILIHGLFSTLHAERTMRCKIVYFSRQRFARAIIDAETLRACS